MRWCWDPACLPAPLALVDAPTSHSARMLAGVKPRSLLATRMARGSSVKASDGVAPAGYALSSAFCRHNRHACMHAVSVCTHAEPDPQEVHDSCWGRKGTRPCMHGTAVNAAAIRRKYTVTALQTRCHERPCMGPRLDVQAGWLHHTVGHRGRPCLDKLHDEVCVGAVQLGGQALQRAPHARAQALLQRGAVAPQLQAQAKLVAPDALHHLTGLRRIHAAAAAGLLHASLVPRRLAGPITTCMCISMAGGAILLR